MDDKLKNLSIQIYRMCESLRLIERLDEIRRSKFQVNNWYDYNFFIDDKMFEEPVSRKFDLDQSDIFKKTDNEVNEEGSLYDVIVDDDEVKITVDMLGIDEEKINLRITSDTVEVMPNDSGRVYHRFIDLPCKVEPESTVFTYKNGILDITISRKKEQD